MNPVKAIALVLVFLLSAIAPAITVEAANDARTDTDTGYLSEKWHTGLATGIGALNSIKSADIDIVGEDVESLSWETETQRETFASRGQKWIYWGPLKRLEKLLLRSWIAPWSFLASRAYHDLYWYNIVGRRRIRLALKTGWGRLFQRY